MSIFNKLVLISMKVGQKNKQT